MKNLFSKNKKIYKNLKVKLIHNIEETIHQKSSEKDS